MSKKSKNPFSALDARRNVQLEAELELAKSTIEALKAEFAKSPPAPAAPPPPPPPPPAPTARETYLAIKAENPYAAAEYLINNPDAARLP